MKIAKIDVSDVRFPTSKSLDGSDAMNEAPDYSCAYVTVETDSGHKGFGLSFTIGRGTEIIVKAVESIADQLIGLSFEEATRDMSDFSLKVTGDSQIRWLGPDKGVVHLAGAAIINAVWDLWARVENKPLWRLVADMTPEEYVQCVDFRYLADFISPEQALEILSQQAGSKAERINNVNTEGLPAYTTSAGWLGYDDDKMRRLCREALADGWRTFKLKVGADIDEDCRRAAIMREEIGYDCRFMVDANQVWGVDDTIANMRRLAEFKPWFIEEPTHPDDILGHAAIRSAMKPLDIGVATGEHGMNQLLFKQLLQAEAIDVCQPDACRLGGVNEALAVLLMAASKGVPVCPHGGGVGLCEHIQHLSAIDYICFGGSLENRCVEFVDHLHEHFVDPVRMNKGRYLLPEAAGYSTCMREETIERYRFPDGPAWVEAE